MPKPIIPLLLLLALLPGLAYTQSAHIYLVKISNCTTGPNRSQTGFRLKGTTGIITALHGIAGCTMIKAQSERGTILSADLVVTHADIKNDLVLLASKEVESLGDDGFIPVNDFVFAPNQSLTVSGHPFGIKSLTTQIITRDPAARPLRDMIPSASYNALKDRGSPDPEITVLSLQGTILPGHSGAPVMNASKSVVAIANGGLGGGSTQITWAIPLLNIQWTLLEGNVKARITRLGSLPSDLFSYDENIPPLFPIIKREQTTFSKGVMETNIVVSSDGRLEAHTSTRGTALLDGFCGNITIWFFDNRGNLLGTYGMGKDHQWCVGSVAGSIIGVERTSSLRKDDQTIQIQPEVVNQTASVSIVHLEGPGKNPAELVRQSLDRIISVNKQPVEK